MPVHRFRILAVVAACIAVFFLPETGRAQSGGTMRDSLRYIVKMKSGDAFRGNLIRHTDSTVTLETEYGEVVVRKDLISSFLAVEGTYLRRQNHFLMPTASPSGPGGFLTDYELGFLYGGVGLGYGATITGAATLIPGIPITSQLFHVGVKITVERNTDYEFAVGAAYTWITLDHPYSHVYAVATLPAGTARYSAMVFAKVTGESTAPIAIPTSYSVDTTKFTVYYPNPIGAAFGFDAPAFGRDDMFWVGEIINNDITHPQNTVSMLGVRVMNETLSADFGVALFTAPFIVPVTSFTWRF